MQSFMDGVLLDGWAEIRVVEHRLDPELAPILTASINRAYKAEYPRGIIPAIPLAEQEIPTVLKCAEATLAERVVKGAINRVRGIREAAQGIVDTLLPNYG